MKPSTDLIWQTAKKSLEQNQVQSTEGVLTVAGANQFKTAWVRDFCYAVPGLLALGHTESVKTQLEVALKYQRADGQLARGFDVIDPKLRVLLATFKIPPNHLFMSYQTRSLKPEFLGEHNTPAVDSNLLVLLACLQWTEHAGDSFFWDKYNSQLEKTFRCSLSAKTDLFLSQPPFSDWQDSARREGQTLYLNLLFCRVLEKLQKRNITWAIGEDLKAWKKNLWDHFFDPVATLFRHKPLKEENAPAQYSLETQLWCIEENIFGEFISQKELWKVLKESPLWGNLPGKPISPDYPITEISWTTKFVGLTHYHDQFHWSWLIGESLKIAALMNDEEEIQDILTVLGSLCEKYKTIHEVYEVPVNHAMALDAGLIPVRRLLYQSEAPFSWGSGKIIEALTYIKT